MKITKWINILLVCCTIIFLSCSPSKRLVYHSEKISKIIKLNPELKKEVFDTSFLMLRDSAKINLSVDTLSTRIITRDTALISSLIRDMISLKDSIALIQANDSILSNEKLIQLQNRFNNRKTRIVNNIINSVVKDTSYTIQLRQKIITKDTLYTNVFSLTIEIKDGNLSHNLKEADIKIPTAKIDVSINVKNKITLWKWIRDEKTLILIIILIILMLVIVFKSK